MSLLDTSDSEDEMNNISSFQNDSYCKTNNSPNCLKMGYMINTPSRPISTASTMSSSSNYQYNMSPFNSTQNVDPRCNYILILVFFYHFNELKRREQERQYNMKPQFIPEKKKMDDMKISDFLKTQKGSRIYQRKLKKMKSEEIDSLLTTIQPHFSELLINSYGNYFCQKLYTICEIKQRCFILENVK
jgi:hypothetical protein